MSVPSGKVVADAVIALLNTGDSCNAMTLDAVRADQPSVDYTEVVAQPTVGGELRVGNWIGTAGSWRIGVRAVGRYEENAYELQKRARDKLEFSMLTAGGNSGGITFESADPVGDDDGWWSALSTYTVTL